MVVTRTSARSGVPLRQTFESDRARPPMDAARALTIKPGDERMERRGQARNRANFRRTRASHTLDQ